MCLNANSDSCNATKKQRERGKLEIKKEKKICIYETNCSDPVGRVSGVGKRMLRTLHMTGPKKWEII